MFERYTEHARRTLFFARYEASQLGSQSIETEHLLLGLLREGKGLTSRIFADIGLSTEDARRTIESRTPPRMRISTSVEIPFSTETKNVLQSTAEEADRLLHNHIGTEHLLLGLLREERSLAAQILTGKGLELQAVRDDIVRMISTGQSAEPPEARRAVPRVAPSYDLHVSPTTHYRIQDGHFTSSGTDYWQAVGFGLRAIIARVFRTDESRIDLSADLDDEQRYDFALRTPSPQGWQGMERLVRQGLERHFHITIARETRPMDVYVLTAPGGIAALVQANQDDSGGGFATGFWEFATAAGAKPTDLPDTLRRITFGNLSASGTNIADLCRTLEEMVDRPVVDETNLTGRYDVAVRGEFRSIDEFFQAMKDQTGLQVSPGRRDVSMLVVRSA